MPTVERELAVSAAVLHPTNLGPERRAELRVLVLLASVCVALCLSIALMRVWLRLQVVAVGYRLSVTRQVVEKLEQEEHDLTVDAARLSASDRIEEAARTRLGMVRPESGQEVILP